MGKTVAIVGGSGYIGGNIARKLGDKYNIKILDLKDPQTSNPNIQYIECDITNYESVYHSLKDVDVVIHTAIIQIPLINEQPELAYRVNIIGTQNVCRAVSEIDQIRGMILSSSWHTIGERELSGVINEEFGFRPDKVEERARKYTLSKIGQEIITRFFDEVSPKIFGIIRMGTVLGDGMPEKTAANIFINQALREIPITPYKSSQYRPMLYVDIDDVCLAFVKYIDKIMSKKFFKNDNSLKQIVNVYTSRPITILELAEMIKRIVIEVSNSTIHPKIKVIDSGERSLFSINDKNKFHLDNEYALEFLAFDSFITIEQSIKKIILKKYTQ